MQNEGLASTSSTFIFKFRKLRLLHAKIQVSAREQSTYFNFKMNFLVITPKTKILKIDIFSLEFYAENVFIQSSFQPEYI